MSTCGDPKENVLPACASDNQGKWPASELKSTEAPCEEIFTRDYLESKSNLSCNEATFVVNLCLQQVPPVGVGIVTDSSFQKFFSYGVAGWPSDI